MFGFLIMYNYIASYLSCFMISLYIKYKKDNYMTYIRTEQALDMFIIQMILYNFMLFTYIYISSL